MLLKKGCCRLRDPTESSAHEYLHRWPVGAFQQCRSSGPLESLIAAQGSVELSIVAFSYMIATGTAWLLAIGGTTAIGLLPYSVDHWKVDTIKR